MSLGPDNVPTVLDIAIAQSVASSPHPGDVPCSGYRNVSLPIVNVFEISSSSGKNYYI